MREGKRVAIVVLALLGCVVLAGSWFWTREVRAQEPAGGIGPALRARLAGQVPGLWVGQVDPRAFVTPGETIEYLVYYGNNGEAIQGASLVNVLPIGVSLAYVDAQPQRAQQYDAVNRRLLLELGDLAADAGGLVRIVARVDALTPPEARLRNTVQSWIGDAMTDMAVSEPTIVQAPRLEASVQPLQRLKRCTELLYTVAITNTGNMGAGNLTVTVRLPDGFLYIRTPAEEQPQIVGQSLIWSDMRGLATDETRSIGVRVRVAQNVYTEPGRIATCSVVVTTQLVSQVALTGAASVSNPIEIGPCPQFFPEMHFYSGTLRDAYEQDDTPAQASILEVDGDLAEHNSHKPADEDWMRFYTTAGASYQVELQNIGARSDALLEVYAPRIDPLSPLLTSTLVCASTYQAGEDPVAEQTCCFEADTRGWYFVRVRQRLAWANGPDTEYQVRVVEVDACAPDDEPPADGEGARR
jgi:hypothetical protein